MPNSASPIRVLGTASTVSGISLSGTTATVTLPDNGYANGQTVTISGADQSAYDGTFVISNVTQDTFNDHGQRLARRGHRHDRLPALRHQPQRQQRDRVAAGQRAGRGQ